MDLRTEYETNISDTIKKALHLCSKAADDINIPIFLIGGIVRDIIRKDEILPAPQMAEAGVQHDGDVDITVEGNAVEFAQTLENKYPETCTIKETHDAFKTAKVEFCIDNECVKIDLASTRKESYPYPSSLPQIEEIGCELYEDVIRRDFTINSMALSLNQETFCQLIDHLGGYEDLKKGIIRILHPKSFIDDPTRILRALKFSVRFGYKYSDDTQKLMQECLDSAQFDNIAGERIKLELKQSLNLNKKEIIERLIKENIYRLIDTRVKAPKKTEEIETIIEEYKPGEVWLVYLSVLGVNWKAADKLYLSNNEKKILLIASSLTLNKEALSKARDRFEIYEFFENAELESIVGFIIMNPKLKHKADLYLNELKSISLNINGNTLIDLGLNPGPEFRRVLRQTLEAKINKIISTPEDEVDYAKLLI